MHAESALDRCRRFVRDHERGLIVAWLALLAIVVGVGFGWGIKYRGFERVVDAYEARWPAGVDAGAQLMVKQRFAEAATALERLDEDFPARSVKHRMDRERERLLGLLAQCYVKLDKKKRALETCARLVAFDPRNWQNYSAQAQAALAFGETDLARTTLDQLLAIHPTHLPSVEARIRLAFEAGAFAQVPPLWRAYLDAYRLANIEVGLGESIVLLEVPSDGLPHRFDVPVDCAENFRGDLSFATHGWSIDVRRIALRPALRVGVAEANDFSALELGAWTASNSSLDPAGGIRATDEKSTLRCAISGPPTRSSRAIFEIVAYKACTDSLRQMVDASYRNLLLWDELESLRARTRVGGCLEAGSLFDD